MRRLVARCLAPPVAWVLARIEALHRRLGGTTRLSVVESAVVEGLQTYVPNSANALDYPNLTMSAAERTPALLGDAWTAWDAIPVSRNFQAIDELPVPADLRDELATAFRRNGSDKSTTHNWHHLYAFVLDDLGTSNPLSVFEFGIGSSDPRMISTMGSEGRPGASLRAFRDALPNARLFGTDIDPRTLFEEDRIRTALLDQTDPNSFKGALASLGETEFDLLIDDGLHSLEANLNSIVFAARHLRSGGWLVIEDIPERSLEPWFLLRAGLQVAHLNPLIFGGKSAFAFALKRPAAVGQQSERAERFG